MASEVVLSRVHQTSTQSEDDLFTELFGFDFDFDIDLEEGESCTTSETQCKDNGLYNHVCCVLSDQNVPLACSASDGVSSTKKRKLTTATTKRTVRPKKQVRLDIVDILERQSGPPPKQRWRNTIGAFPALDQYDSLVYFANALCRNLNSGDYAGLLKQFTARFDRQYEISINHCQRKDVYSCRSFVRLFELTGDLQPDRITYVFKTSVVENKIISTMIMRSSDYKKIHQAVIPTVKDPHLAELLQKPRKDALRRKLEYCTQGPEEMERYNALVEAEADVVMDMRMDLVLTFDDVTKKVTSLEFTNAKLLNMQPALCPC
jgi:hypothetical protein